MPLIVETEVLPPERIDDARFGTKVAVSGETLAVAAPGFVSRGAPGTVWIFERDAGGPGAWGKAGRLTASFGIEFGRALSLDGGVLVAGGSDSGGLVFVFERDPYAPEGWTEVAVFEGTTSSFGDAVAVDGDRAVIGDPFYDGSPGRGAIFVIERQRSAEWTLSGPFASAEGDSDDFLGRSVAVSKDRIAAGNPWDGYVYHSGSASVFEPDPMEPGSWREVAIVEPPMPRYKFEFGTAVALAGDRLWVGALEEADDGPDGTGSLYLFARDDAGSWRLDRAFLASDADVLDHYGIAVAAAAERVLVGADLTDVAGSNAGSAYLYQRGDSIVPIWAERRLDGSDGSLGDSFGAAVALDGELAAVGAPLHPVGDKRFGSAFVFRVIDGPELAIHGSCPGEVSLALTGAAPGGEVVILGARRSGRSIVPGGPCAGTDLDLEAPRPMVQFTADPNGEAEASRALPPFVCANTAALQALDVTTCTVSPVLPLVAGGAGPP